MLDFRTLAELYPRTVTKQLNVLHHPLSELVIRPAADTSPVDRGVAEDAIGRHSMIP